MTHALGQDFELEQLDSTTLTVEVRDKNKLPFDLSLFGVFFVCKIDLDDPDADVKILKKSILLVGGANDQLKITNGPKGLLEVYLTSVDSDLEPGVYPYVIKGVRGPVGGPIVDRFTLVRGNIHILHSIYRDVTLV